MRPALVPLVAAALALGGTGTLRAQDPVKVAPQHFKVLLENDHVRVLDFRSRAGQKIPMHSHPGYVVYSISGGGKTRFTTPDGKTTEMASRPGQARWRDAETHASEYVGRGEVHVLMVEIKEAGASER